MIEIKNFGKQYGDTAILHGLSLTVRRGEALGLTGASGCGKTTLLRCICGLDPEYTGEILINGQRMERRVVPHKRNIALVMQEPVLWPHMTVKENILYPICHRDRSKAETALKNICTHLQIEELLSRYPEAISGGQAKRVAFARAMMADKDILLLDEPLSNVDDETRQSITAYLKANYVQKKTIIYVSHDQEELASVCDTILRL